MGPVCGKGTGKGDQCQASSIFRWTSLKNKQIKKKNQIDQGKHDTGAKKTVPESLSDMRRIPFLVGKQPDQYRYRHAATPHKKDMKAPFVIHMLYDTRSKITVTDEIHSQIPEKSAGLKKGTQKMAF